LRDGGYLLTDIRDDRLTKLIAQIHSAPSPEQAFSRWLLIDIFLIDGLAMAFIFLLILVRDLLILVIVGCFSVTFIAVYLAWKRDAKTKASIGISFLDSQTIIGDMEIAEQIGIKGYEYVVLPESTIEGREICYRKTDLDEVSQALVSPYIRFGGESTLRPSVIDQLVQQRLRELKEEAERRVEERKEKDKTKEKELMPEMTDVPMKKSRFHIGRRNS
jgi:hypothetical protein